MNRFLLGFCVTTLSALLWPALPPFSFVLILLLTSGFVFRLSPFLSGSLFAVAWLSLFFHQLMSWNGSADPSSVKIEGEIIALVHSNGDWINLDIELTGVNSFHLVTKKLRLTWSKPPPLQIGQTWQLTIRPKSISSVLNQGGYNQQKNLLSKHIIAKGKVLSGRLLKENVPLRAKFIHTLVPVLASFDNGDLMLALIAGDKQGISAHRWQALRQTGTGHLMAISGLHLSVVGVWVFVCVFWLLRQFTLPLGRSHLFIATFSSLVLVGFYAYLAGFSISTQRAFIMLCLVMGLSLLKRFSSPWERLLYALFFVLLLDPVSCLSPGFWLSFGALAIILLTIQSHIAHVQSHEEAVATSSQSRLFVGDFTAKCWLFWGIQWRLSLGLGVLQAIFFGGITLHSFWINLILVPWFSLVVIPVMVLTVIIWSTGLLLGFDFHRIFLLFDWSLWPVSELLALSFHFVGRWIVLPEGVIDTAMLALLGGILWFRVLAKKWKVCCALLILPFILQTLTWLFPPKSSQWAVHILDVGQGLAVLIEKSGHGLLYDTGAAYGEHFSYADRVIIPFLGARGIRYLDYLILSHGDNDHAGGADDMIRAYPNVQVITDIPAYQGQVCRPHELNWQGLQLKVLGPIQKMKGNNGSCVIQINDAFHSVLLTGDIEGKGEALLLKQLPDANSTLFNSTLLIAPHHGSLSSSSHDFITAILPQLTVFPAGLNNRYGFPKPEVVSRYMNMGSQVANTGEMGQISVFFDQNSWWWVTYRQDLAPFWYNRLFGFGEVDKAE
ncbi:DNA internalization-related competence protein ComEC/Rec2 [uncultured Shewanella sp.]|uniref:DNA internalization-related competence protein ComEC/Rec2 n=1 Tax=uncultured Shewanella sp. TaxID=173975 RepID=UPI002633DC36|nr:DNA internalization-related competence protein ComEC/Rec2 [uncultured Shewanella sp.]